MKQLVVLATVLMAAGVPSAAIADPDVSPASRRPSIQIKAEKFRIPEIGSIAIGKNQVPEKRPSFIFFQCPVDADVGNYGCRDTPDDDDDERDLTEGDVLRAAREIGLPRLPVSIQPGERTLVNADTIFSTAPVRFNHSVTLLGFDVDLVATPTSYTWHHGDGTSRSTSKPGRPYPAFDVTHRYRRAADVVRPSVDVTYQVRYRVDGGAWTTISQTITAPGPAAELEVREAVPVLTKP